MPLKRQKQHSIPQKIFLSILSMGVFSTLFLVYRLELCSVDPNLAFGEAALRLPSSSSAAVDPPEVSACMIIMDDNHYLIGKAKIYGCVD